VNAGTPLVSFQDFVLATKSHKITPTTEILNECARRSYLLSYMLKGRGNDEVVQSGKDIIDQIQLRKHNGAGFYQPNESLQPRGMDTLVQVTAPWRFHQSSYAWTDHQIELQLSNGGGSTADIYTKLKASWEQASDLSHWDSLEEALWATPDAAGMEVSSGKTPYSIPTFITTDGLAPAGFTTISGLNPATEAGWRNQTGAFDWSDRELNDAMYKAFDAMMRKLRWKKIARFNAQTGSPSTDFDKVVICTTTEGVNGYLAANRSANDRLRATGGSKGDAGWGQDAKFNNITIEDLEILDETTTGGQPPFFWLNLEYLFPVFHSKRYMMEVGPIQGSINQPFSWAVYKDTWLNLFCRSRRRQGKIQTTA
jgi:hypothetical protein